MCSHIAGVSPLIGRRASMTLSSCDLRVYRVLSHGSCSPCSQSSQSLPRTGNPVSTSQPRHGPRYRVRDEPVRLCASIDVISSQRLNPETQPGTDSTSSKHYPLQSRLRRTTPKDHRRQMAPLHSATAHRPPNSARTHRQLH